MNAETILRSDVLDIIFENRNKQYGAYALRRGYDQRLYKAMGITLGSVLLLFVWNYWQTNQPGPPRNSSSVFGGKDSIIMVTQVEIPKEPLLEKPRKVASIANPPIKIVPDNQVTKPIPTVDDFDNRVISDITQNGDTPLSDNEPTGTTDVTSAAPAPPVEVPKEPEIYDISEVPPAFPGGMSALIRFLGKNLQVPEDAMEPGQRVKIPVKFVVGKDGNLSGIEFQSPADEAFKKEIIRVFNKMPKWNPGYQNKRPVSVYFTIPIIFEVPE